MQRSTSQTELQLSEVALIAGTRVLVGAGLGLLAANRMGPKSRQLLGWGLFGIGALSTIPLAMDVLGKHHHHEKEATT